MNLSQQTRRLLNSYKLFPKKNLGQHFVITASLLQRLISYAEVNDQDIVLEVGAGLGFLTELLSQRCKQVVTVEFDSKLVKLLRERLHDVENIEFIEGNILKASVPRFNKVVSTPPYLISSHLLFWLLDKPFDVAVMTLQKEFADRLAASVGTKDYGRLTISTYYRADVELLEYVPKTAFFPPPNVDSIVVKLKHKSTPPFRVEDESAFFALVQMTFAQRNKKLHNTIPIFLEKLGITREKAKKFAHSLPFGDKRVFELAPEELGALINEIFEKTSLLR